MFQVTDNLPAFKGPVTKTPPKGGTLTPFGDENEIILRYLQFKFDEILTIPSRLSEVSLLVK